MKLAQGAEYDDNSVLAGRNQFPRDSLIQAKGRLAQAAAKVDGLLLTGGLDAPADYTRRLHPR